MGSISCIIMINVLSVIFKIITMVIIDERRKITNINKNNIIVISIIKVF